MVMPCMDAMVLAGGENSRFPTQKAFADLGGEQCIDMIVGLLRGVSVNIYLSTNSPELFFTLGLRMIGDVLPVRGPMNGICSVLEETGAPCLLAVPCDMPLLSRDLLELLLGRYDGQDAVVPVFEGRIQPLPGIYSGKLAPRMRAMAFSGRSGLRELLGSANVSTVAEAEIRMVDPEGRTFMNINTVEDYQRVNALKSSAVRMGTNTH